MSEEWTIPTPEGARELREAGTVGRWRNCRASDGRCQCCFVWAEDEETLILKRTHDDDLPTPSTVEAISNAALIVDAVNAYVPMAERVAELQDLLRELEWVRVEYDTEAGGKVDKCPCCGEWKTEGHFAGCQLADALEDK